ncbi:MAG: TatD family hydrolase [Amphiamblys sp. WSBS2006]|nr:MAG: TatD family hydrolase [Amphiamblys sp. WSBS2006]
MRFFDIGANMTDRMFQGEYNGKRKHEEDVSDVLARAETAGVRGMVVTAGKAEETLDAVALIKKHPERKLWTTFGIHPTNSSVFSDETEEELLGVYRKNKDFIVAVGECGLDYDRLEFADKATQKKCFELHFNLSQATGLPMFLHLRNAFEDFVEIVSRRRGCFSKGVVHSFTGSEDEMEVLLGLGLHIGVNGCSLKKEETIECLSKAPLERIMFETDAPWCGIRRTHAGMKYLLEAEIRKERKKGSAGTREELVKGRNEPCNIDQVCFVFSRGRREEVSAVSEKVYENTVSFFLSRGDAEEPGGDADRSAVC